MKWQYGGNDVLKCCCRSIHLALLIGLLIIVCQINRISAKDVPPAEIDKPPAEREQPKHIGFSIRLTLPIDDQTTSRVSRFVSGAIEKAQSQNSKPYLIFEFFVPAGQENFGRVSDFESCLKLAKFLTSNKLNDAQTVAYLPQSIQGHALLAVMACDNIIMAPKTTLGPVGIDKNQIDATMRAAYRDIPSRRRRFTTDISLGMLDPSSTLYSVKTEVSTDYILGERMEEYKQTHKVISPEVFKPAGEPLQFSSEKARDFELVSYLAANRRDLAQALDISTLGIEDDPSLEKPWKAVRIELKGPVTNDKVRQVQKLIEDQIGQNDVNFICLWIESPGGSPVDSSVLANYLLTLDPSQVRTVAYVQKEALADAALIAVACDQLVMLPKATLGGPGALAITKEDAELLRKMIRDTLAPHKARSWSLLTALIDSNIEVYRCTRPGEVEYFSPEELAEQANPEKWEKGRIITAPGRSLKLDGTKADDLRIANRLVSNFDEFKKNFGLENDPALVEPGWADHLIEALSSKGFAILLLVIGIAALYFEFHIPGLGVGAFVALACFVLFFWSQFLNGAPGWLISLMFLCGVACILLEIFVIPGFGIFGLGGGAMVIMSLVLASQILVIPTNSQQFAEMQRSLLLVGGTTVALFAAALMLRKWLPNNPITSHIILAPPDSEERESIGRREMLVDLHNLVGNQGTTTTLLMPAGKARFADSIIDVIADGEMIEAGKRIEVVEVQGNRVVVREVSGEGLGGIVA
jgi:membrane-bound serine protease (ClpP class)